MTAHEQKIQDVVSFRDRLVGGERELLLCGDQAHDDGLALPARALRANVIGNLAPGDVDQPRAWVLGQAVARPLRRCRDQRLLNGVFRGTEVAETMNDRAEHLRRELAQQVLGLGVERHQSSSLGGSLMTWRTSMARLSGSPPTPGAADASAATV